MSSAKATYNSQGLRAALVSGSVALRGHFTEITASRLGLSDLPIVRNTVCELLSTCCLCLGQGTLQKVSLLQFQIKPFLTFHLHCLNNTLANDAEFASSSAASSHYQEEEGGSL